jgi:general L-amino acid transport system permease protein
VTLSYLFVKGENLMSVSELPESRDNRFSSYFYDPKIRGIVWQALLFIGLFFFVWWIVDNTIENLRRSNIASGFGFLRGRAGFDVSQAPIEFTSDSTYMRALYVGMVNTLIVSAVGIVTALALGFLVGVGRLSRNWLVRSICTVYVEIFRNIPPLLQIFFWYFGVLSVLPQPKESLKIPFGGFLNSRGFFLPKLVWSEGSWLVLAGVLTGIILSIFVWRWASKRQSETGLQFPVGLTSLALIIGMPLLAFALAGFPLTIEYPKLSTFNLSGGFQVKPEFMALYFALSIYTASFIAEIVRGGILGVAKGQSEASAALGLSQGSTLRLVVIPQAMRIIIPPLTSQFLNLTKNSSLAIAIGYPDLVAVGGTILNQTGQAIEIVAIWMLVYLGISLATSLFMNLFNAKMALVER